MVKRHLYLQWDSTDICNLKCSHCYHVVEGNFDHSQEKAIMPLEDVISMIDDLRETSDRWNMIPDMAISGGEPLKRRDLFDVLDHTSKRDIKTRLLTNGTLITPEVARDLKAHNVQGIQISIDGKKALHNEIRGMPFAYDRALEGIYNSSRAGIPVTVSMTLMQSNKNDFENIIQAAIQFGADRVGFKSYVPDSNLGDRDPNYMGPHDFCEMVSKTMGLKEKYSGKIGVLTSDVLFRIIEDDNPMIARAKDEGKFLCGCSAGYRALSVLSDGTVYPCRRMPIDVGHISQGITSIFLENDVMKNLRDMDKMRENASCDEVVHCRGCRAVAYAVTGDYMHKDPMCYKNLVKEQDG